MKNKFLNVFLRAICFFLFFSFSNITFAQRQSDNTINGMCDQSDFGCEPPIANMIIKFNEDSIESIIEPLNLNIAINYSRAAYSDKFGNLLFACNGWRLVDNTGSIITHKLWREDIPWPGDSPDSTMVLNTLGPLFLNDPGDSTKAFYFMGNINRKILGLKF
jgi:hypothetical protein